jgi:hypothetical protein
MNARVESSYLSFQTFVAQVNTKKYLLYFMQKCRLLHPLVKSTLYE